MNEYDEILDGNIPEGNEYDALLNQQNDARATQLKQALYSAARTNPDQQQKVVQLSRKTGLPPEVVERNTEEAERTAALQFDYGKLIDDNPKLAEFLANPENAKIARDDVDALSRLEALVKVAPTPFNIGATVARAPASQAFAGEAVRTPGAALSGLGRLYGAGARSLGGAVDTGLRAVGADPVADVLGKPLPWWLDPEQILRRPGEQIEAAGESIGPDDEDRDFVTDVAGGLGQLASQITAAIFLGPAATSAMLFGQGADIQGDRAEQEGATQEEADTSVVLGASVTAVTEKWGLDKLLERVPPNIKNRILQQVADVSLAGGIEAVQELVEGVLQNVVSAVIYNPEQELVEGLAQEGTTSFAVGSIARGLLNAAIPGRQAQTAKRDAERLQSIADAASESKLRERDPARFEELIRQAAGEEIKTVYANAETWDTLFQDGKKAAEEFLGDATAYNEAKATGGDIAIPIEIYALRIAPTEFNQTLLPQLKFAPDAMTLQESQEWEENRPALVESFLKEVKEPEVKSDTTVFDDVLTQLANAGIERNAAEQQARLLSSVFNSLGQRTGIDPNTLYQRYGLTVQRDIPEALRPFVDTEIDPLIDRLRSNDIPDPEGLEGDEAVAVEGMRDALEALGQELDRMGIDVQDADNVTVKAALRSLVEPAPVDTTGAQSPMRQFFQSVVDRVTFREDFYTLDGQRVIADPDTPRGMAIRSLAQPRKFPLDDALGALEDSGLTDVANEVREQVEQLRGRVGFELHQTTPDSKRGQIQFDPERKQFRVTLLQDADLSTFLHESGHFFLEVMQDVIDRGEANAQLQADLKTLLDWMGVESAGDIRTEHHEQFARGFEAYLMEGKAPSPELTGAFARFRAWLIGVYKALKALNVTLTDDVRGVFDRLVATDEEIEAANESQNYQQLFEDAQKAGMTEAQFEQYRKTLAEARQIAEEEVTSQQIAELHRAQKAWWKDERAKVREQVAAEVGEQPVYQAMQFLQKSKATGDDVPTFKLSKQDLVDLYGKEFLKRLPRPYVYTTKGGVHPDVVADLFGFTSGNELVQALANARPIKSLIEAETDKRMEAEYGNMLLDGTLPERAMKAVHNDKRLDVMLAEQRALDKLAGKQRRPSQKQVIKAAAERIIGGQKIRDINPNRYRVAEAKAAREAFEAAGKQDFEAAAQAKSQQALNHELYRQAQKAREQADKHRDFINGFNKKSKRERLAQAGADYLEQIDTILGQYEFRNVPLRTLQRRESLAEFLRRHRADVEPIERPKYAEDDTAEAESAADSRGNNLEALRAEADIVNWRQLTIDELQGVRDNVQMVWHLAKLKDKLLKAHAAKTLSEAATLASESIRENANREIPQELQPDIPSNIRKRGVSEYLAQSRRIPSFVREMDGGEPGAMWNLFIRPLNEATSTHTKMTQKFSHDFADLYSVYSKKEQAAMLTEKRPINAINRSLTKDAILAVALNWGNETNRQRLMSGEGWTEGQVAAILDTLDARDWQFVQSVWDYLGTYWEPFAENHKALYGLPPEKVESSPVKTKFGEFKGGYYPIKFDATRSAVTDERQLRQEGKRFQSAKARTMAGSARQRARGDVSIPLRLSAMSVIPAHVGDTIQHIAFDQPILDAARILNHKAVRDAIIEHYGKPVFDRFNRLLIDMKFGTEPAKNVFERFVNHVRNGASVAGMAFSVTTAALQPLGLSNSVALLGYSWVGKGLARLGKTPKQFSDAANWAISQSEFMQFRRINPSREIGDVMNRFRKKGWRTQMDAAGFWLTANIQFAAVDLPTWYGAYEKAKAAGVEHAEAVALADQAVRDAQGGGELVDQTEFQRGGPMVKLFTNFMSYMSTTWSIQAQKYRNTRFGDPTQAARYAHDAMMLMVVPAVGSALLDLAASELRGDDEDDEDFAERVAIEAASMFLGPFVGLREFSGVVRGFSQYEGPAGLSAFGSSIGFAAQLSQGEADEAFWRSLIAASGPIFHLPAVQIDRTLRGAAALYNGETDNPAALLLGPPRD